MSRIGIFSGSFDPVHKGHIAFALAAAEEAGLDKVYLAPEVKPRRKPHVSHIAHRLQMLQLAVRVNKKLDVLELPDKYFLSATTLPKLQQMFPNDSIVLLMGSDLFDHMHTWPQVEYLLKNTGLIIGVRGTYEVANALEHALKLPAQPHEMHVVDSIERELSSKGIRASMRADKPPTGLITSVEVYAKKHWLYHDIPNAKRSM